MTILVTGSDGLVGYALRNLKLENMYFATREDADLSDREQTMQLFSRIRPSQVIHLAAQVAGIGGNMMSSAEYFRNNILINVNTLEAAKDFGVTKLISFMSTCVFPSEGPYPLDSKKMHDGPPHPSNFGYAYAKRMLDVQTRAYRHQWGMNFFTAIPCNIYGPNDNYSLVEGHVIPALIHKLHLANTQGLEFKIWGDGTPKREFIYSLDMAKIIIWMLKKYDSDQPLIVAPKEEISIRQVAELLASEMKYDRALKFDETKPNGQERKPSNSDIFYSSYDGGALTSFPIGLSESVKWFLSNYPRVRGVHE